MGVVLLARPGTENHGKSPAGNVALSPLYRSCMTPSRVHTRIRVMALTITRNRA
jgi:hypothetical protein